MRCINYRTAYKPSNKDEMLLPGQNPCSIQRDIITENLYNGNELPAILPCCFKQLPVFKRLLSICRSIRCLEVYFMYVLRVFLTS